MVDLGRGPVPVRWGQITEVTYAPPPARTLTLKVDGDPLVIPLGLFGGSHGIMATVHARGPTPRTVATVLNC